MSRYNIGSPNRSLFIKYIPFDTRSEDLRSVFSEYGRVKDVYIPRDYYTRRIRGFAYVEFERLRDAEYAVRNANRLRLFGQELQVEFAQGDRKTPKEMRFRYCSRITSSKSSSHRHERRHSYYRSCSRSRTPQKRKRSSDRSRSRTPVNYRRSSPPPPTRSSNKYRQTNYQDDFVLGINEINDNYASNNIDSRAFAIRDSK